LGLVVGLNGVCVQDVEGASRREAGGAGSASAGGVYGEAGGGFGSAPSGGAGRVGLNLKKLGLWANDFNFTLHGINFSVSVFKSYVKEQLNFLREFYHSYLLREKEISTHFAQVRVYYRVRADSKEHVYDFPQLFVSGNFAHTFQRNAARDIEHWPEYFKGLAARGALVSLGDCYDGLTSEHLVKNGHLREEDIPVVKKVINDFNTRGINLRTENSKGKETAGWNNIASLYAHSEQAFLSCVLNNKIPQISDVDPTSITIVITGYHEACDQCSKAFKHLLYINKHFQQEFIGKLFPRVSDPSSVKMNVIYVAADKKTVDDNVDLGKDPSYFIEARQ